MTGKHQPISVRSLRLACRQRPGTRSRGGKPRRSRCRHALPACAFVRRIEITGLLKNRPEEWLLIEWPEGEEAPTKYWFSTLPANIAFHKLVGTAKLRWRIERDYQELKQEVGLGHFEGRGWRGFHHHATLCIAAYGFLISERETIPLSGTRSTELFKEITIPATLLPEGVSSSRPERHIPNSIATIRRRLSAALVAMLSRCPCCVATISAQSRRQKF